MKKLKQTGKRGFSLLIAGVMCLSLLPAAAFAEGEAGEAVPDTVQVESKPGGGENGKEEIDVTVTVKDNGDGTTTTTVSTAEGGAETDSGLTVEYQEVQNSDGSGSSSYQVTDGGGYSADGGSETTVEPGAESDVTADVVTDGAAQENASGSSNTAGSETTGSLQTENPANYDQTTVTTTDRTVNVYQIGVDVITGDPIFVDENGNQITPDPNDGYHYYWSSIYDINGDDTYKNPGLKWNTGWAYYTIKDADGNIIRSKGEGVCQRVVGYDNNTPDNFSDDIEISGLYCADLNTGIQIPFKYRKANLEDAIQEGYYSEEEVAHLRAIMKNGWDWSDRENDTANLDGIKTMLMSAQEQGLISTEVNIEELTKENAATATGMAIWQFGNRVPEGCTLEMTSRNKLVDAVYQYLITLTDDTKETQIINEEKFVDDLSIVVGSMVKENEQSQDDDTDNDVYNVSLKFSLVVEPDAKNDDMIVKVLDGAGNVVKAARIAGEAKDGENIGFAQRDENGCYTLDGLQLAENSNTTFNLKLEGVQHLKEGVYVFQSQQLTPEEVVEQYITYHENNGELKDILDEEFNGNLEKFKEYILEKYGNRSISQNFIGKSFGTAEVDVSMQINMTFNVEESTVTTEHVWRDEQYDSGSTGSDPDPDPDPDGPDGDIPEPDTPEGSIPEPDVPLAELPPSPEEPSEDVALDDPDVPLAELPDETEILDEEVPLANVPQTGEASTAIWLTAVLLAGAALVYLNIGKRRKA